MATKSGTSVRGVTISIFKFNSSREDSEDDVAELAGAHHSSIFEPEDTSSDHSESSNKENEVD